MANININFVLSFLVLHNYATMVRKQGDGCLITYPHPVLLESGKGLPQLMEHIEIVREPIEGLRVSTTYDEDPNHGRFIAIPEYAIRLYILNEIHSCNRHFDMHPDIVVFLDENEKVQSGIDAIIDSPTSFDNKSLENFLSVLISE